MMQLKHDYDAQPYNLYDPIVHCQPLILWAGLSSKNTSSDMFECV